MNELDAVATNARQLDQMYDTPTTNALVVAVKRLTEKIDKLHLAASHVVEYRYRVSDSFAAKAIDELETFLK